MHEEKIPLPVGRHCFGEFYEASPSILDCEESICAALETASETANAQLLKIVTHKFSPQGVTGFALLAESHISIHTWPELGYATVDAFTCGSQTRPDSAIECLQRLLGAKRACVRTFDRDYVNLPRFPLILQSEFA